MFKLCFSVGSMSEFSDNACFLKRYIGVVNLKTCTYFNGRIRTRFACCNMAYITLLYQKEYVTVGNVLQISLTF